MYEESSEDFKRRLQGTFVFLTFDSKPHLVYFKNYSEVGVVFNSSKYGEVVLNYDKARKDVKYSFPKTGLYNLKGECVVFQRRAERQWKRAPCEANTQLYPLLRIVGARYRNDDVKLNEENLEQIYEPTYPASVLAGIETMKTSAALSRDFGISLTNRDATNEYLLWYRTKPIGYVDIKNKNVVVHYKPLLQEVTDFLTKDFHTWNVRLS